ncbi:hypothetical protein DVH24_021992, partial [Malus domestica]
FGLHSKGLDQNDPLLKQAKLLLYPYRFQIRRTGEKIVGVVLSLYIWDLGIPTASFDGIEGVLLRTRGLQIEKKRERERRRNLADRQRCSKASVSDMEEKLQELMILPTDSGIWGLRSDLIGIGLSRISLSFANGRWERNFDAADLRGQL